MPIARMVDDQMVKESSYEPGTPAYNQRKTVLVRDMFNRALGRGS